MNGLVISAVAAAVLLTTAFYTTYQKNEEVKAKIETTQALLTAQKASTISDIKTVKLSSLAQNTLTAKEKVDLNNFQRAINVAVIKNNIANPTCNDLATTGYITLSKCNEIKAKTNNYASIANGQMKLDNNKAIKIISNIVAFKSEETDAQQPTAMIIKPYNKRYMVHKFQNIENQKSKRQREVRNIAEENDIQMVQTYAKAIIKKADATKDVSEKLNLLQSLATSSNRIKQIHDHERIASSTPASVVSPLLVSNYINYEPSRMFINQEINKANINDNTKTTVKQYSNRSKQVNKRRNKKTTNTATTTTQVEEKPINSKSQINDEINNFTSMFSFNKIKNF